MNPIHVKLSQLREARGWTQAELAERAGVTRATVSRIEGRKVASLNIKVFEKLADALDVDPTVLIDRSAEEEVTPRGPERRSGVERRTVDLVPRVLGKRDRRSGRQRRNGTDRRSAADAQGPDDAA